MELNTEKTYDVSRNVSTLNHIKTIKDIFSFLEKQSADWSEEKIFIDGEYDSNQTKFERDSNDGKIGILSNSDNVGHCLLVFLRMIIDRNFSFFFFMFDIEPIYDSDGVEDDDNVVDEVDRTNFNLTMMQIFNVLKKQERTYTTIFGKNDPIKIELMNVGGKHIINKKALDVDLWNLSRIRDELLRLLEAEIN